MAMPREKSPSIDQYLEKESKQLYGRSRKESILSDICVKCGEDASMFENDLYVKEYVLSGFCQKCQDSFF